MNRTTTAIGTAIATLSIALVLGACSSSSSGDSSSSPSSAGTWKVGLEAPLSGDQSNLGQGMLQGAQFAADEVNGSGGVLGKKIEIVPIDDAADPDTGVTAANEAIKNGLDGIVGPYNSSVGAKTLPLYTAAGLVPIRLTSDNSTNGMGFTLQPMSNQIAPVTTQALTKFYRAKSVGILYDSTQNYTTSTSAAVKSQLEKANVKVTGYVPIKPGQSSYAAVLEQVAATKPQVIYSAVYYPEGANIAKECASTSKAPKPYRCLLDYASYDSGYIAAAGSPAAEQTNVVGVPAPGDFANSAVHVSAFDAKFNQPPGTWSPYTYDSVNFLIDAVKATGKWDASTLNSTLSKVTNWQGWTGSVTIEPKTGNRNPATVVVTAVRNGEFHVDSAWAKAVGAPY